MVGPELDEDTTLKVLGRRRKAKRHELGTRHGRRARKRLQREGQGAARHHRHTNRQEPCAQTCHPTGSSEAAPLGSAQGIPCNPF